jgi:hypothetical protein
MITTGVLHGYGRAFRCWLRERRRRGRPFAHPARSQAHHSHLAALWHALERAGPLQDRLVREPATI